MKITDFALSSVNDDGNDFEPNKLYPILEPLDNDPSGHLRIIDESGEDYLYPEVYFQIVNLNRQAQENLLRYFELSAA
ncbi:MAG: hypothetical protein ACR2LT_08130 [Pyrinomonadaceae bacterium]